VLEKKILLTEIPKQTLQTEKEQDVKSHTLSFEQIQVNYFTSAGVLNHHCKRQQHRGALGNDFQHVLQTHGKQSSSQFY